MLSVSTDGVDEPHCLDRLVTGHNDDTGVRHGVNDDQRNSQTQSHQADVDEDLETETAVLSVSTDGVDEPHCLDRLVTGHSDDTGVRHGVNDNQRNSQTQSHQADVDEHPDELFNAERLQRVSLPPATVGGRAVVTTTSQADDHHQTANDERPDGQDLGHGLLHHRPHLLLEEDALSLFVLSERTERETRLTWRERLRTALEGPKVVDVDADEQ